MSSNQLHGKTIENLLKSAFPGSSDFGRSVHSFWDVESKFDKFLNLPTSIKTTCNNNIDLADARKFWLINEEYRLCVIKYNQFEDKKSVEFLYEFLIDLNCHKTLIGSIVYDDVVLFHNKLLEFKYGRHLQAREFAKQYGKLFENKSLIKLNPKIDSKYQRRLQCSITIDKLLNYSIYNKYSNEDFYRDISLNISIKSSKRQFNKLSNLSS